MNDDKLDNARADSSNGGSAPETGTETRTKLSIDTPSKRATTLKRRWMLVGSAVFVGLVAVSSMLSGPTVKFKVVKPKATAFNLTPPSILRESFHAQTQASLQQLTSRTHTQRAEIKQLLTQLQQQRTQHAIDVQHMRARLLKLEGAVALLKQHQAGLEAEIARPTAVPARSAQPLPQNPPGTGAPDYSPPSMAGSSAITGTPAATASAKPLVFEPPGAGASSTAASTSFQKNPYAGYIPSGSFMPVVLLTGVEAGTASSSQGNPEPVLMRVENLAQLPGNARYKVRSCFVTGSAYGSMSTERAYVRIASLSCLDKHHKLVLDAPLKGYVVDSDGMFGLRGKLVQRQGALLGKALLAGFAQGLGNAFSMSEGTTTLMMGMGGMGAAQTLSGGQMLHEAGMSGATSAMQMLAQFYLKQAQSIFPVVVVRPGREATLVLSSGTSLQWHEYGPLYVQHVQPK